MTVIAGIVHRDKVYIGADSAGLSGWDTTIRADAKVFINGPFVMGFTTSFRMGQLLRWSFTPPAQPEGIDIERYMVTTFIDAVRECLKAGGWSKTDTTREEGGDFLVGYRGRLFAILGDYQVAESVDGYDAVGAGAQIAIGALHVTKGNDPRKRLRAVLSAAARHSGAVAEPFLVIREP